MERIEKSIEVRCPVHTVYNQWTQFEEFPRFMEGVEAVRQLSDDRLHWVADIGGRTKEWDARIVQQIESWAKKHGVSLETPGWKPELAKRVKQRLLAEGPKAISNDVLDRWARLFEAFQHARVAAAGAA